MWKTFRFLTKTSDPILKGGSEPLKKEENFDPDQDLEKLNRTELLKLKHRLQREEMMLNAELRRMEMEKRKIEQQNELTMLRQERDRLMQQLRDDEDDDDDGDDYEDMFGSIIKAAFSQQKPPVSAPVSVTSPPEQTGVSFSDEQIRQKWGGLLPHYKAIARRMSDEELKEFVMGQVPNITQESLNKVIEVVRHD